MRLVWQVFRLEMLEASCILSTSCYMFIYYNSLYLTPVHDLLIHLLPAFPRLLLLLFMVDFVDGSARLRFSTWVRWLLPLNILLRAAAQPTVGIASG